MCRKWQFTCICCISDSLERISKGNAKTCGLIAKSVWTNNIMIFIIGFKQNEKEVEKMQARARAHSIKCACYLLKQ